MTDSFKAKTTLNVGAKNYDFFSLGALESAKVARLPFSLKILLESGLSIVPMQMDDQGLIPTAVEDALRVNPVPAVHPRDPASRAIRDAPRRSRDSRRRPVHR